MTKSILPLVIAMVLFGCATGGPITENGSPPAPEWLLIPPHEEGFFYGIGGDTDLDVVSASLLEELVELGYESIDVVGHANPTGDEDESEELAAISRGRAETMAERLSAAGIAVDTVSWKGGDELAGDPTTDKGKGLNRRVEIVVSFE